jgi:hypothetical protein
LIEKGFRVALGRINPASPNDVVGNVNAIIGRQVKTAEKKDADTDLDIEGKMRGKIDFVGAYVRQSSAVTEVMGNEYFYLLQPILLTDRRECVDAENDARRIVAEAYFRRYGIDILNQAEMFWNMLDRQLHESGIRYVNLNGVFSCDSAVYSDHIHYNDYGNFLIAERIAEILAKEGVLPAVAENSHR